MRRLAFIWPIVLTILVYMLLKAAILGLGIAVGFVLTWLLPALDLGLAVLIGVVATGISLHFFGSILRTGNRLTGPRSPLDLDEEEAQDLVDVIVTASKSPSTGKRRKRWEIE